MNCLENRNQKEENLTCFRIFLKSLVQLFKKCLGILLRIPFPVSKMTLISHTFWRRTDSPLLFLEGSSPLKIIFVFSCSQSIGSSEYGIPPLKPGYKETVVSTVSFLLPTLCNAKFSPRPR